MKFRPKSILVAVDAAEPARNALEAAQVLAEVIGGELELVCVINPGVAALYGGEGLVMLRDDLEGLRAWAQGRLSKLAAPIRGVRVRCRIVEGTPEAALSKLASSGGFGLVVLGTHGYTGLRRVVFGSVAEAVVRHAAVPVLTLPPGARFDMPRRFLVPYNMAPYAGRALRLAGELAEDFGGRVSAVFVAEEPEEAVKARLFETSMRRAAGRRGSQLRGVVRIGNPVRTIIDEAESGRHDILVLAVHRKSFWKDMLLGTTAERVLRHCPIPLLAVPSGSR